MQTLTEHREIAIHGHALTARCISKRDSDRWHAMLDDRASNIIHDNLGRLKFREPGELGRIQTRFGEPLAEGNSADDAALKLQEQLIAKIQPPAA